jgi:hypothetical protein
MLEMKHSWEKSQKQEYRKNCLLSLRKLQRGHQVLKISLLLFTMNRIVPFFTQCPEPDYLGAREDRPAQGARGKAEEGSLLTA